MSEQRRVVETALDKNAAYSKCFKRATQLGYNIKANIPGERLEVTQTKRTGLWWTAVIIGFIFYILPGVLVLFLWKPEESCSLVFDDSSGKATNITAEIKGEFGSKFFNEISGLLL